MINKDQSLSVIVPLFNESRRISKTLPLIENELQQISNRYHIKVELILVNDGSGDDTLALVKSLRRFSDTKYVDLGTNRGKGFAIKKGFEIAAGDYILFMDADLSTPLSYLSVFLDVAGGNQILIGNRKSRADLIKIKQSWLRRNLGRGFTLLCNFILRVPISDFTCGFKLFPRTMGQKIFRNLRIARWGFDAEAMFLAKKYGYAIKEIPVSWSNDDDSKVKLSRDVFRSLADIIRIRINNLRGGYERK